VLSADYFSIPEEEIKDLESVLTIVGGKVVYGAAEFENLGPPAPAILPEWSPVVAYGGYAKPARVPVVAHTRSAREHVNEHCHPHRQDGGSFGCLCWAF